MIYIIIHIHIDVDKVHTYFHAWFDIFCHSRAPQSPGNTKPSPALGSKSWSVWIFRMTSSRPVLRWAGLVNWISLGFFVPWIGDLEDIGIYSGDDHSWKSIGINMWKWSQYLICNTLKVTDWPFTWTYLLEIISPIFGWCSIRTFTYIYQPLRWS